MEQKNTAKPFSFANMPYALEHRQQSRSEQGLGPWGTSERKVTSLSSSLRRLGGGIRFATVPDPDRDAPLPRVTVADHQPLPILADGVNERAAVLVDLGLERRRDHPASVLARDHRA